MQELLGFAFGSAIGHNLTIFGSGFHFRITEYLSEFTRQTAGGYNMLKDS
jgi:hypothetical protein